MALGAAVTKKYAPSQRPLSDENSYPDKYNLPCPRCGIYFQTIEHVIQHCHHFARQGTLMVTRSSLTPFFRSSSAPKVPSLGHAQQFNVQLQTVHSVQADPRTSHHLRTSDLVLLLSDCILVRLHTCTLLVTPTYPEFHVYLRCMEYPALKQFSVVEYK
jgi:hypothetical protein